MYTIYAKGRKEFESHVILKVYQEIRKSYEEKIQELKEEIKKLKNEK